MKTRTKIAIARWASWVIRALGRWIGWDGAKGTLTCSRRGVRWSLDLREGVDLSIFLLGRFEPGTSRALEKEVKPGATVLDIGANIGAHTLPLAKLVGDQGRVLAFEATDFAFKKLRANLGLNPALVKRVAAHQVLLGDGSGEDPGQVFSSWPLETPQSAHPEHGGVAQSTSSSRRATLDQLLEEARVSRVDFIKLDVDGNEGSVLAGARRMLERDRPVLFMELAPYVYEGKAYSFERTFELLRGLGYVFSHEVTGRPLDLSTYAIPTGSSINVIARASTPVRAQSPRKAAA